MSGQSDTQLEEKLAVRWIEWQALVVRHDDDVDHFGLMEPTELRFQNRSTVRRYNQRGDVNRAAGCLAKPRMR